MNLLRTLIVLACGCTLLASPATGQHLPDITAPLDGVCDRKKNARVSPDAVCHFVISGAGSAGFYALGRKAGVPRVPAMLGSAFLMGTLGYLHETGVLYGPNSRQVRVSHRDLAWNGAGIVVGVTAADLWLTRRKGRSEP
jgi:hypothetical protein